MALVEYIPITVDVLACFSVALVAAIEGLLLFASIKKIVSSYHCGEKGRMDKEVAFYLLLAVAEKASQDKKADYDEKAFASVGANAPEEVVWNPNDLFKVDMPEPLRENSETVASGK